MQRTKAPLLKQNLQTSKSVEMTSEAPNTAEWPVEAKSYELMGKIGQGAFASVWKAADKDTKRECAVKVLNLDHVDTNLSEIRLEVQAMRLSSHPNVLACYTAFVNSTELWLVTHLMRKGSSLHCLQSFRRRTRLEKRPIPPLEDHIMYILHETLLGLHYIHEKNGQIHRDLKAGNVLVDGNGDVRIADFGVSGWLEKGGSRQEKAKTFVGTPCWMAPEVMEQIHGYDYKADIWSFGITAMELAKGYAPYGKFPPMKVLILTIQEEPPSLDTYDNFDDDDDDIGDEEWSSAFHSLINLCLQKNPAKRPTTSELLQSRYFSSFSDDGFRTNRRERMKSEICDQVPDVGMDGTAIPSSPDLHSKTPVSIVLSAAENNRPAGTSWVFADGSQVMASTTSKEESVEDVIDALESFGKQIGGENYNRNESETNERVPADKDDATDDDVHDFMDEFEKTTGGENFRHPKI